MDTAQGGFGFKTKNKALTVEILFKTTNLPTGKVHTQFKSWEELKENLSKENHLNYLVYCKMKQRYKHLIPIINERGFSIDTQLPSSPHWSYTLLKVGAKGCRHLRKLLHKEKDLDNSKWPHLVNGTEFMDQIQARLAPYEAQKVIASVYRSTTVPLARDLQISLLRNNLYTRELLYNMKVIDEPYCSLCPMITEDRVHRLWSCPYSKRIWKLLDKVFEETMEPPVFAKEAMLGDHEMNAASHRNITILYTKWYIDQAKREEKSPNLIHFAAALSNVLRAKFEFMQKKYDSRTKEKLCSQISAFYLLLSKLDQIRQEETSYY